MHFSRISEAKLEGKRVIIRMDLNLPIQEGRVTDWTRLERCRKTINYVLEQGGDVTVFSHLGRPKGQFRPEFSFSNVIEQIANHFGREWALIEHTGILPLQAAVPQNAEGKVLLLDNVRFFEGEANGDLKLSQTLSTLGDIFCLDAFSVSHRDHSSVSGIPKFLPSYAGFALSDEVENLNSILYSVERPSLAIVGGAKVSTKISVLRNLIEKADTVVVGGGMANTFLEAKGIHTGKSLYERQYIDTASELIQFAETSGVSLVLPTDVATHHSFEAVEATLTCDVGRVRADQMILDFGPNTIAEIIRLLRTSKTVLWNGPLGAFELEPFDFASVEIAKEVARLSTLGALTAVAGGGDTLALLSKAGVSDDFTFCSTGGGAFLEWLEGRALPGLQSLEENSPS